MSFDVGNWRLWKIPALPTNFPTKYFFKRFYYLLSIHFYAKVTSNTNYLVAVRRNAYHCTDNIMQRYLQTNILQENPTVVFQQSFCEDYTIKSQLSVDSYCQPFLTFVMNLWKGKDIHSLIIHLHIIFLYTS